MDVFEALGVDLPDRAMSEAEMMQLLAPVFGWDENEASANSLILFPGDASQPGCPDGLLSAGSRSDPPEAAIDTPSQALGLLQPPSGPVPAKATSPFSGISQFDLFLGSEPAVPTVEQLQDSAPNLQQPVQQEHPAGGYQALLAAVEPAVVPATQAVTTASPSAQVSNAAPPAPGPFTSAFALNVSSLPANIPAVTAPAVPEQQLSQETLSMLPPQQLLQQTLPMLQQTPPMLQQTSPMAPLPQLPQQTSPMLQQASPMLQQNMLQQTSPTPQQASLMLQQNMLQQTSPMLQQNMLQQTSPMPQQTSLMLQQEPVALQQPVLGAQGSPPLPAWLQGHHLHHHQQQQNPPPPPQQALLQPPVQLQQPAVFELSQQLLQQPMQLGGLQVKSEDEEEDQQQFQFTLPQQLLPHHQQQKRRGRPPKVPGQYSKGYEAIKRYREKKKGMVGQMEAEVALKREQLQALQAEHEALRSRQMALESSMTNQDKMLAQLLSLQLSVGEATDSKPNLEDTTAAAIAGVQQALAMQTGDIAAAEAAAAAAAASRHHRSLSREQLKQQRAQLDMQEAPVFWRRYQAFVQAAANKLAEAQAAFVGNPQQQEAAAEGFPAFPFSLVETLSLWKLSRLALLSTPNNLPSSSSADPGMAVAEAAQKDQEVFLDYTLNLSTGQHDRVPAEFWRNVAQQVQLSGDQLLQLDAAWRLYATAMNKLNAERQELLVQLRVAAEAEGGSASPAAVQQLPSSSSAAAAAAAAGNIQALGSLGVGNPSNGNCNERTLAAASPGTAIGAAAGTESHRTGTAAMSVAFAYLDVLDAVERNLLRGRAVIMMFGWSMLCMLNVQQIGRICVASWPYFPLMRAVVGYMLGKDELVP